MIELAYGSLVQWFSLFSMYFLYITALCVLGAIFGIIKEFLKHV